MVVLLLLLLQLLNPTLSQVSGFSVFFQTGTTESTSEATSEATSLSPPSERRPSAHADRRRGDVAAAAGAHRGGRLPVPPAGRGVPGVLRRRSLQPDQFQPDGADGEEHPGVGHGAERAGRVAGESGSGMDFKRQKKGKML